MRFRHGFISNSGYSRCKRAAFTLIEIMMAMTIFALIITAIYASWTLILKSAKIGQEAAAQIQRQRIAMRTIKESLACVQSFQADQQHYAFVANNDNNGELSFSARLPDLFPRNDTIYLSGFNVRRVTFVVENKQLIMRQTPILKDMHSDEQNFPFVVARGVDKMELQFWDLKKGEWADDWTRTNELPRMIKIGLTFIHQNSKDPYASQQKLEQLVDIMPLPTVSVPPNYQAGNRPPQGGGVVQPGTPPPITP